MKSSELKNLEMDELKAQLEDTQRSYFKLRTQREVERITDRSGATKLRRTVARIKTEIRARQLQAQQDQGGNPK